MQFWIRWQILPAAGVSPVGSLVGNECEPLISYGVCSKGDAEKVNHGSAAIFSIKGEKKAVKKRSTKWYIADVCSAANPIKVPYIVSSRILIVSNLGTTREQVEIGETPCSALHSASSIQFSL